MKSLLKLSILLLGVIALSILHSWTYAGAQEISYAHKDRRTPKISISKSPIMVNSSLYQQNSELSPIDSENSNKPVYKSDYQFTEAYKCMLNARKYENKYGLPSDSLLAIAINESGKRHPKFSLASLPTSRVMPWPWAVNLNNTKQSYYFSTKQQAIDFVRKEIIRGNYNIDIGCAQINLKHHSYAFDSLEQSFDPEINMHYAAYLLRGHYEKYNRNWYKAIAVYHSKTENLGLKYANKVIDILRNINKYKINDQLTE